VLQIFIALKNQSPWPGFEPATFGSSGQHTNHYTTKATFFIHRLNKSVDNESPCFNPTTILKLGDNFFCIFTLLCVLSKVNITSLTNFWYYEFLHYFYQLSPINAIVCLLIINVQLMYIYIILTCLLQGHSQAKNLISSGSDFPETTLIIM
jgi:hypothetical protein